jgi:glyoxylase-like metal-dependent hydrolase (beta-lactamase superfamily II)
MKAGAFVVEGLYDPSTSSISYILLDPITRRCAIIDSVLDFDPRSGRTSTFAADRLANRVAELGASVQWLLETHIHADHISAAQYLKQKLGGQTAIGAGVKDVQHIFGCLFNAHGDLAPDGSQFDRLLKDGDTLDIGVLRVRAMHTPGHTPACITYIAEHEETIAAFIGDTLFMPDSGTARCDFPGGDAQTLYHSIGKILGLGPQSTLYVCHDYCPGGRPVKFATTVAEEREHNIHVGGEVDEACFIAMRNARDATLAMPVLMLPSVQINIRAGQMPAPESNGISYLKVPLNAL